MAVSVTSLTRVAGMHSWPAAPASRAYLASPHRHMFHVRATVAVDHEERDVEFHDLGLYVTTALHAMASEHRLDPALRDFGPRSCESIARLVAASLCARDLDVLAVSCSEDDEFTATWTKD